MRLIQSREVEIERLRMIYVCPECRVGFTLPVGDYLIERNEVCFNCKTKADLFIIGKIGWTCHRDEDGSQNQIYTTMYEK